METRYRYRPIAPRDDTEDIKRRCGSDSVATKEGRDSWNTLYNDTYIRHPLGRRSGPILQFPSIHLGGGPLAPPDNEMRFSDYGDTYRRFAVKRPELATGIPPSDIIPHDDGGPMETVEHTCLKTALQNRPVYDNTEVIERGKDARSAHFMFGGDKPEYRTNYATDYTGRRGEAPATVEGQGRSSIVFDKDAGVGPHTKAMQKREQFPSMPDADKRDMHNKNFDFGYARPAYETTTEAGLRMGATGFGGKRELCKAPPCAELSNHGDAAGKWQTFYETDYQRRNPIPNEIDDAALRRTHWDVGHDKNDWRRDEMAVSKGIPKREYEDMQKSNQVFRGDGGMTFHTTSNDMIGNFDKSIDGRGQLCDGRKVHMFLGGDKPDWQTTAKEANRFAGQGRPAEPSEDLYKKKGASFAKGGQWGELVDSPTDPEEKRVTGFGRPEKVDGSWFRETHFDLDAAGAKRGGMYETTYFEEICRPKIL